MVVGAAFVLPVFVLAVLTWGVNLRAPSVYLHALHAREGWPLSLISGAITPRFLFSAVAVARLPALLARFGPVAVTRAGISTAALGVAGWGNAAAPWHLVPTALLTATEWALTSGALINVLVSRWFERRRPAALAIAYNGASAGGIVFTPLWAALIGGWGFGTAAVAVALAAVLVVWPMAGRWFRRRRTGWACTRTAPRTPRRRARLRRPPARSGASPPSAAFAFLRPRPHPPSASPRGWGC